MKNKKFFYPLIIFGIILLLDAILSIIFGNSCLDNCFNNNNIGNAVRIIRGGIGIALIFMALKNKTKKSKIN